MLAYPADKWLPCGFLRRYGDSFSNSRVGGLGRRSEGSLVSAIVIFQHEANLADIAHVT